MAEKTKHGAYRPLFVGDEKWWDVLHLPSYALKVWLCHYMHEDSQTRESWPAASTVGEECGMHRDTVFEWRAWLVKYGWLTRVREFQGSHGKVPVFRIERGLIPTDKESATDEVPAAKVAVSPTDDQAVSPTATSSTLTNANRTNARELIPTKIEEQNSEAKLDPVRDAQRILADSPDAQPLTKKFAELSRHWIWKKNKTLHWELCNKAFESLLARPESEAQILRVMEYMAHAPEYKQGVSTVAKVYPWDWFLKMFDQIAGHMESDKEFLANLEKRIEQRVAVVQRAKSRATQNADKPEYRRKSGDKIVKQEDVIKL